MDTVMVENQDYINSIVKGLKEIIKNDVNTGIEKPYTEYCNWSLEHLKKHYKIVHKWSNHKQWMLDSRTDVSQIWAEIKPAILSAIERFQKEYKHKKLTKEIQSTSARVIVKEAMKEAGFKHNFIGQTYRVKVTVLITHNRTLTVYIPYKKLIDCLPTIIESIKNIRKELESLGSNVSINKAYYIQDWEE